MVPNVTAKGRSFNGAFAYYLHDKRREGEARRDTSERVAWTETRNLATDDPDEARRVMIATARSADALKKAAGVRAAGRKSTQHVYAYSLSWSTAEAGQISPLEMRRAADASLKALGAEHLQAVFVAHQDTKHPHVHIILNRVDPATGKMHGFSNDHHQLDAWALAYREARGEHLKYAPARAEKRDRIAAERRAGAAFSKAATPPRKVEPTADLQKAAAPVAQSQLLQIKAADLAQRSAAMRERHSVEWRELSEGGTRNKAAAYDQGKADLANARSAVKEEYRPHWRDLFKRQAAEKRTSRRAGLLATAWAAWTATREDRGGKIDAAWLATAIRYIASRPAREKAMARRHEKEQRQLGGLVKRATDHEAEKIRETRGQRLDIERKRFAAERAALIERQAKEKAANRLEWRDLTTAKEAMRGSRPTDPAGRHFQTAGEIRAAAGVADRQPRQTRGRSTGRTRSRTRDREPPSFDKS